MAADVLGQATLGGQVDQLTEMLAGLIGTAAKLHLYKDSFVPTPASLEADFEGGEADFTGYAPVALTYGAVGLNAAGQAVAYANRALFIASDAVAPNTIGGAWTSILISSGPDVLRSVQWFPFQAPINMTTALAQLAIVHAVTMPPGTGFITVDR